MPFYLQRGSIPTKRHIQHPDAAGNQRYEELVSREGFSDIYSNLYHSQPPTAVRKVGGFERIQIDAAGEQAHRNRHFRTFELPGRGNWVSGRIPVVFNDDVAMYTVCPVEKGDFFYRNGNADEILFVHVGSGVMESMYGRLEFGRGDYIVIPRGVTYRLVFEPGDARLFVIEARGPVQIPKIFKNKHGQVLEDAPYCERDFRVPEFVDAVDKKGAFPILVKLWNGIQRYDLAHHPFDVIGWDGYFFPWIFNIDDYMPKVGKVHLPPPAHLTFEAPGFVVCSFVPRPFDFHEKAVPIPYAHSNVDSDEILYYVAGQFMSRRGIEIGSITLHPAGLPHGPQPGLLEKSLGATETNELAVMVDTFRPLNVAAASLDVDDSDYPYSWLE